MPDRFASTADHYAAHRPDFPDRAVARVCDRLGLDARSWVLDLGCGTGEVALPLSRRVGHVVGVDPSRPTLRVARRRRDEAGRVNVSLVQGTDAELTGVRRLDAATVGRALHRMDRDRTLDRLRSLVDEGVAILGDPEWLTRGTASWQDAVYEVVSEFADPPPRTGPVEYDDPYHAVLRNRGYRDVAHETLSVERTWSADGVVGYCLSLSYCSPAVLGDDRDAFERALRARLAAMDAPFHQTTEIRVTTGQPPSGGRR